MQNNETFAENPNFENAPLIRVELNEEGRRVVSARELYAFLEIETRFNMWISRMFEYDFKETRDFCTILCKSVGGRPSVDYALTLSCAKEIAVIQNNPKGRQIRKYFLWCEENLKNLPTLSLPTVGKDFFMKKFAKKFGILFFVL